MNKFKESAPALGIGIALIGVALFAVGQVDESTMLFIIGFGGFGSLAAVRTLIDSAGAKTFLVSGIGMVLSVGIGTGFVDAEVGKLLYAALVAPGTAALVHGNIKKG